MLQGQLYISSNNVIVLCTDPEGDDPDEFSGVLMRDGREYIPDEQINERVLGHYSTTWLKSAFKKMNAKVVCQFTFE